jgi:SCY1-like protein 1
MVLKIGDQHLSSEEYEQSLVGLIVRLFASPDRPTRLSLLENLGTFIDKLDKKAVNDKIFPQVVRQDDKHARVVRPS